MNTAYVDCFSGVSGNMLLGALIDSGLPEAELKDSINSLNLPDLGIEATKITEKTLAATRVTVKVSDEKQHRHLSDIENIIQSSGLEVPTRKKALEVFQSLAKAEADVHGCDINDIHFHEVGAADALADVVGVIHGFNYLGIRKVICSPLPVPRGWVQCAHGDLPVPAPAVCKLMQKKPVYGIELDQELITPTGAALVHILAEEFGPMPPIRINNIGYGAGTKKRKDGRPNLLRLIIGETIPSDEAQQVVVIETAIDDWNPETWPHVSEKLFQEGALDVILIPVQMKKGRPGFLLKIICEQAHALGLKRIILSETSSIGLRFHTEQRMTLPRELITVQTQYGPVSAKKIAAPEGTVVSPEYEDCRRVAIENNIPIQEVYSEVIRCSEASG